MGYITKDDSKVVFTLINGDEIETVVSDWKDTGPEGRTHQIRNTDEEEKIVIPYHAVVKIVITQKFE